MPFRRTKIVATIGPASQSPEMVEKMIIAGVDSFRCNFSHATHEWHKNIIKLIRKTAQKHGREVCIFADLQGPKIRISKFKKSKVILKENAEFILDAEMDSNAGDEKAVGVDYKALPNDVLPGDFLLLNDGLIILEVKEVVGQKIICRVDVGGELTDHKGLNKRGGGLSADALTDKDKSDLKFAAKLDVDFFAVSFVRDAEDVLQARKLVQDTGSEAGIISKVERAEAVIPETLDRIINASDAVMVARGDLGVEVGDAELPAIQKHMISRARALNKPVITATQMMESMIHNMVPSRAEVSDVANAVLDNTDAVMLSAETASGDHPDVVVKTMSRICMAAERQEITRYSTHRVECKFEHSDEAIAMAAMYTANHVDIKAVIALTESGNTALLMSRIKSGIPIFALTRKKLTERKANLYRDVFPMAFDPTQLQPGEINRATVDMLKNKGVLNDGDMVIITHGGIMGESGQTNTLKLLKVGEH